MAFVSSLPARAGVPAPLVCSSSVSSRSLVCRLGGSSSRLRATRFEANAARPRFFAAADATVRASAPAAEYKVATKVLTLETGKDDQISYVNLTPYVKELLEEAGVKNGTATVFSRHTTTAVYINEDEERLLVDIKAYLRKLAPEEGAEGSPKDLHYLHNDLHLRPGIPEDEPINAQSHLQAMTLSQSETIPVFDGKLALGTWQSVMLIDLDGPRTRTAVIQVSGI
eukprot:tig00000478_g1273.t1